MGILSRFKDIMASNINALLDKCEDPEKMIDQYIRNAESDLGKVKSETAAVMAEETRAKRVLDECNADIEKMQSYAVKAVEAGNDEDARQFLTKKKQLEEKKVSLQQAYDLAAGNAAKMRQMHDKLVSDINELNAKRDALKAKLAVAKTQEKMNKLTSKISSAGSSVSDFENLEAKIDKRLDQANAMAELNNTGDSVDTLAAKYDTKTAAPDVEDELAALKASLGK
jgi:phage shock protein A